MFTSIKSFLQQEYQLGSPAILTSSAPDTLDKGPMTPKESPDRLPTFNNIKQEFDAVHSRASAGDLFFFHISGHGARLNPVKSSPAGRPNDPSLDRVF
ncbi:caspase domain-containing protein [Penicillium canescens]|nr:caspase domain-containing protein [Penicillium canescens]